MAHLVYLFGWRNRLGASLAWLFLSGLFSLAGATTETSGFPPPQTGPDLKTEPVIIETFLGEKLAAESGFVTVPENRRRLAGASIRIAFVRIKSSATRPAPPVFYLAGGPGSAGIPRAGSTVSPICAALSELGDVILFDQRGTGRTEPSLEIPSTLNLPLDKDVYSPETIQALEKGLTQAAKELKAKGIDLASYNTNESADDVDDLRKALGYDKIRLWGHSYGSHLGLAVLKRHKAVIDKVILGGINGPDHRWRFPSDGQRWLEHIAAQVKAHPVLGREMPDLVAEFRTVLHRLEQKPVTVEVKTAQGPVSMTIGPNDVRVLVILSAGEIEIVKSLPQFIHSLYLGDFAKTGEFLLSQLKQRPLGTAMRYAMVLASGVSDQRKARIAKELADPAFVFRDAINFPFNFESVWQEWGILDLGPEYRRNLQTEVPTLFLSGTLDGRTSQEDAGEVAAGFSKKQQVIIEGVAHDFYNATPKIKDVMVEFLRTGLVSTNRITVPMEFRGPNERAQIEELHDLFLKAGSEVAAKRFRQMMEPKSGTYVSSYVLGILGFRLLRQDKKPQEALAAMRLNQEYFPQIAFTHFSLGEIELALGHKDQARSHFKQAVAVDSYHIPSLQRLRELK
ncbi:MAG: alpha/beta fold hydrolase [Blastocatellia bacterium]|nr:alpha/beta fold hydrolase [Blastocatellia bacterium]